jgi:hypothetical protein
MLRNNIKNILKQYLFESENNQITLTSEKYINLLEFLSWDGRRINNVKGYKDKTIVVDGDVDLVGTPVVYLGNVTFNGRVRAENSELKSIQGAIFNNRNGFSYYNTPYYQYILHQQFLKKKGEQDSKREEGELNDIEDLDKVGLSTLALYQYLIQTEYEEKTPEDSQRLQELYAEKERREEIEKETEDNENLSELEIIEDEIKEIESSIDVYDLHYEGNHYYLPTFKLLTKEGESRETWAVGNEYDTSRTAYRMAEDLMDDVGLEGLRQSFVEDYIDEEELKDYFRESEEDNVRENLEDYFDEDEFEYEDPKVQERIDEIEELLEDSENLSEEETDELNEELDELKDSDKTVPESLIDDKVESLVDDLVSDPVDLIKNYGLELKNFVDMGRLINGMVEADGYGHTINNYNGEEDTVEFNNETYYIFQIDG